jgi:hypothetical protein
LVVVSDGWWLLVVVVGDVGGDDVNFSACVGVGLVFV